MPQPPPPLTYASLCSLFISQLTVAIHTILAARALYPANSFLSAKAYNFPVKQSRHPALCAWINDAAAAVETQLLKGIVRRVVLVIFEAAHPIPDPDSNPPSSDSPAVSNPTTNTTSSSQDNNLPPAPPPPQPPPAPPGNRPLERYIWDVARLPTVPKPEINTPLLRADDPPPTDPLTPAERAAARHAAIDKAHVDLQEQFRGLLARLSTVSARLKPLPPDCTYTLCVELKDDADPPLGHPQPWIPAETGLQSRVFHGEDDDEEEGVVRGENGRRMKRGGELGGARTVPVRTVDAGEMVFEMWIEEGAAKF